MSTQQPPQPPRRSWLGLLLPALLAFIVLVGLGTWQVERKAWMAPESPALPAGPDGVVLIAAASPQSALCAAHYLTSAAWLVGPLIRPKSS